MHISHAHKNPKNQSPTVGGRLAWRPWTTPPLPVWSPKVKREYGARRPRGPGPRRLGPLLTTKVRERLLHIDPQAVRRGGRTVRRNRLERLGMLRREEKQRRNKEAERLCMLQREGEANARARAV